MRSLAFLVAFFAMLSSAIPTAHLSRQAFDYRKTVISRHNVHRSNHSASHLFWDESLAATALQVAQTCVWAHNMNINGGGYGQNIAAGISDTSIGSTISDLWYNGEVNNFAALYNEPEPDFSDFGGWGHFTQLVWKGSSRVGCASWFCNGGLAGVGGDILPWFTVCNYKGPGNWAYEYAANVGRPLGMPTVSGN